MLPGFVAPPAIQLKIDAREVAKQVVHVHLTFPVKPGPITLEYPKWIPGMHEPSGPVQNVVQLGFSAQGKKLPWRRDPFDYYAFQTTVPQGAQTLEVTFDYLPRTGETDEIAYGVAATEKLAVVNPSALILVPRGADVTKTPISAQLQCPVGWKHASALVENTSISIERLADSPVFMGQFLKMVPLPSPDGVPHALALFGDSEEAINPNAHVIACLKRLVRESATLFGARHYQHFTFLLALTNGLPQYGLEHHASTVNVLRPGALGDGLSTPNQWNANLLPHEFVHSWNGKHRRPYGLAAKSFNRPLSTDLLWVYEGLTEYLGEVLMVRSGFYPLEAEREHLRQQIVALDSRSVRTHQSLRDAALAYPLISSKGDGRRLRLSNDVYYEAALHWLEADTIIRRGTEGKRSLDDFCRGFFGGKNRGIEVRPYQERELIAALQAVLPTYDWARWLQERFDALEPSAPRLGIEAAGWRVALGEVQDARRQFEAEADFRFSLGFQIGRDGRVLRVEPDSPAAKAGIVVGDRLSRLGDQPFRGAMLREQVRLSRVETIRVELQVESPVGGKSVAFSYKGGERLPILIRDPSLPDLLAQIFGAKERE